MSLPPQTWVSTFSVAPTRFPMEGTQETTQKVLNGPLLLRVEGSKPEATVWRTGVRLAGIRLCSSWVVAASSQRGTPPGNRVKPPGISLEQDHMG